MQYGAFYMQSDGSDSVFESPIHYTVHTDSCKSYHIAYATVSLSMNSRGSKHVGYDKN